MGREARRKGKITIRPPLLLAVPSVLSVLLSTECTETTESKLAPA